MTLHTANAQISKILPESIKSLITTPPLQMSKKTHMKERR
jgi:hypothetical protein